MNFDAIMCVLWIGTNLMEFVQRRATIAAVILSDQGIRITQIFVIFRLQKPDHTLHSPILSPWEILQVTPCLTGCVQIHTPGGGVACCHQLPEGFRLALSRHCWSSAYGSVQEKVSNFSKNITKNCDHYMDCYWNMNI